MPYLPAHLSAFHVRAPTRLYCAAQQHLVLSSGNGNSSHACNAGAELRGWRVFPLGLENISAVPFGRVPPPAGALAGMALHAWQRLVASMPRLESHLWRSPSALGLRGGQLGLDARGLCQALSAPTFYRQRLSAHPE